MANRVTISVIGSTAPCQDQGTDQEAVNSMIAFWQNELDQVWPDRSDLIILPELCDQYVHHQPDQIKAYCQQRGSQMRDILARLAADHQCYITYPSVKLLADETMQNAIELIDRTGQVVGTYYKNYPTISEIEQGIVPGCDALTFACDFGRVACAVCFDLNFDELRVRYMRQKPDLILFSSMYHGGLMQSFWAYSMRAHLASAVSGPIPSQIISPVGHTLASTTNYRNDVTATVNLDTCVVHLDYHQDKLRALKRELGPKVSIFDPGRLGSVLVSSETEDITAAEMIKAFDIESLDDYLERASQCRDKNAQR